MLDTDTPEVEDAVDAANRSGALPVVFIHGLWLLPSSWDRWGELFAEAGFAVIAPGWPDDPDTVELANQTPEVFANKTVGQVADHYERVIRQLDTKPVLVGHSFGGLVAQILAGRGLAAATAAIDPAPFRGVLSLPLSSLRAARPVVGNPLNRHRAVPLTFDEFRFAFANAVDDTEAHTLYETFAVPAPGAPLFQAVAANLNPRTEVKVDTRNPHRGPLLLVSGARDNTVPWALTNGAFKRQRRNPAVTEIIEIPGRGHALTIDHGWREVATTVLDFFARVLELPPSAVLSSISKEQPVTTSQTSPVVLEPAAQKFADATSTPPFIYQLPPEQAREVLEGVQRAPIDKPEVDIEDLTITGGPNDQIAVRLIKPAHASGALPVILYLHGAGWVLGSPHTHDLLVRNLAVGANAAVVFPDYRRAPEAQYPSQIEESYKTATWITEHGAEHGLDPTRLAIAGDSCGGTLTIAVTLLAKERGGPSFSAQLLYYPVTDAGLDTDSYHEFAEHYFLTRPAMAWFWDQYLPDDSQRGEILASPLRATLDDLAGLPPTLVINGEADVLRDEGEAFAEKLRAAGVPVTQTRYGGIIHDFVMLHPLAETHAAQAATTQGAQFLHAALHD